MVLTQQEPADVEQRIRQAAQTGRLVDLSTGTREQDDPTQGTTWSTARTVPAELLVELLTTKPDDGRARAVKLRGARITGPLDLEAATLASPLLLRACYLDEPVNLQEAQAPAVRLPGCHLPALNAERMEVRGNLELNVGFTAYGEVTLRGAHIGGELLFGGATLLNPDGVALDADGLLVDQSMRCHRRFCARGEVHLRSAHIGGVFTCNSAELLKPNGRALWADGLTVGGGAFFMKRFRAEGEIRLLGAQISSQLNFLDATLSHPNHVGAMALQLQGTRADELWLRLAEAPDGVVSLINVRVGTCYDSKATWPERLYLNGFVYDKLQAVPEVGTDDRLAWLERDQDGYIPQLYEQLATVYRNAGDEEAARRVAIAKLHRRQQTLNWPGKLWNSTLHWLVGYGYRTWQAVVWLLVLLVVGTIAFAAAHPVQLTPAKTPEELPAFNPAIYTLDVLLPIVDLDQQNAWLPHGMARWVAWGLILAGWVLTTAVVAGLTGLLKRD
jgi:hypothetical protein